MANNLGGTYNTGTVSINNGDTTLVFSGTMLTTQAIQGDHILVNGLLLFVNSVTDDTHIEIFPAYSGSNLSSVSYLLEKVSWSRYDPAILQQKVREFVTFMAGVGVYYFVTGSVPDPGVGDEGQFALKTNAAPWHIWYKTGGVWVDQGVVGSFNPKGQFNIAHTYVKADAIVYGGNSYYSLVDANLGYVPDSSPTQWVLLFAGGDRYDIAMFDTDRPASGELVLKIYPNGVTFASGLGSSKFTAEVGATGAVHYSIRKNDVEFATINFAAGGQAGSQNATLTCATSTTFASGDKLTIVAPAVRDNTLSGVGGNLIGSR